MYIFVRKLYDNSMETTISVMDAPVTPTFTDRDTNYLVRVQYEYTQTDFVVFGPIGLSDAELLAAVQRAYPRDEATQVVRWASL